MFWSPAAAALDASPKIVAGGLGGLLTLVPLTATSGLLEVADEGFEPLEPDDVVLRAFVVDDGAALVGTGVAAFLVGAGVAVLVGAGAGFLVGAGAGVLVGAGVGSGGGGCEGGLVGSLGSGGAGSLAAFVGAEETGGSEDGGAAVVPELLALAVVEGAALAAAAGPTTKMPAITAIVARDRHGRWRELVEILTSPPSLTGTAAPAMSVQ